MNAMFKSSVMFLLCTGFFLAGCSQKQPTPLSSYQDLPTVLISQIKTNTIYKDILDSEYQLFREDDELATKSLEDAFKKDPNSNYIKTHLAYQYAKSEKIEEAARLLEGVLAESPKNFDALFLYARVLAVKGEFDKSKSIFLQILDLNQIKEDPDKKLEVSFILASLYVEKGELIRAGELLKSIIAENPEHLLSYYYLGRVYSEQNKMKESIKTYKQAVEIDPRFSLGWRALGLINDYFGNTDEAIDAYERVVTLEVMNVDVRTKLIDLYLKKNEPKKAVEQIITIKRMYPNVPDISVRLGLFYYQEKMYVEAEKEFLEATKKFKNDTDFFYYLGLAQFQLKKKDLAIGNFSRVSPESEIYTVSQLALSTLYEDSGQTEKAEKTLLKALKKTPLSVDLRVGLAHYMIRQSRFSNAQKILEEGIEASPKEEKYYLSLAEIFEKKKDYDNLEKTIRTLLAINPDNTSALNFLGYSYADRGIHLKEAEEMIVKALKDRPDDGFIQDSLGWVYYQKKEFKKAEELIRKALKGIPDEPVILEHLADILVKQGKTTEAVETYQKALKIVTEKDKQAELEKKIKKLSH